MSILVRRILLLVIFIATLGVGIRWLAPATPVLALTPAPRGTAHDLWADVQVGRRSFGEISPGAVDPTHLFQPGGVVVDRNTSPGHVYVWDSGNNRILGFDLGTCYGASKPCTPDIVLGQPSATDYGACNLDASYQYYPERAPSSASTLCGISDKSYTSLEDKSISRMAVDADGSLYVVDTLNNRVLKYLNPFTTDTVADEVWGQADFTGNECNRTGNLANSNLGSPTADSFCFLQGFTAGLGLAFDPNGNMWVADGSNNRILRFPKNQGTGVIAKTADMVIGQPDFTTQDLGGTVIRNPSAITFTPGGDLLVVENKDGERIARFNAPLSTNMPVSETYAGGMSFSGINEIKLVPGTDHILVVDTIHDDFRRATILNAAGDTVISQATDLAPGLGPFDFDTDGNILYSAKQYQVDIRRLFNNGDGTYTQDLGLLERTINANPLTSKRFGAPAWPGLAVIDNQVIANDGRMLFWNNADTLTEDQDSDGFVGGGSVDTYPSPGYGVMATLPNLHQLWVSRGNSIDLFNTPVNSGTTAVASITSPLTTIDGKNFAFDTVYGLAALPDNSFLWVSDTNNHRVFRVRDPATTPKVDVVLGQTNLTNNNCNRGAVAAASINPVAALNMLCFPGHVSLDKQGNLYVSENFLEIRGNHRVLVFSADTFSNNNSATLYAPMAIKSFPIYTASFQIAFDSANHMVSGYNPYQGGRFVRYFIDPVLVNGTDNQNSTLASPSGQLNDFVSWATNSVFDSNDNLWIFDGNRGQVRKYLQPFTELPTAFISNPVPLTASSTIDFTAEATASAGLDHIELLVDGTAIATSSSSPITTTFDTSHFIHNSYHAFTARVTDLDGKVGETSKLVKGIDATPPTSSITFPSNGASVARNSTVNIAADATDNAGVYSVEFRVNNTLKCTDATAPYTCSWKVPNSAGSYTLKAKAIDKAGNNTTDTITVTSP